LPVPEPTYTAAVMTPLHPALPGQAVDEEKLRAMTNEMMFEAAAQLEAENAS